MTPAQWWMLWSGLGAAVIGTVLLAIGLRGDPSRHRARCPKCWYDLAGLAATLPLICPECGREVRTERALVRRRRFRRVLAAGALMLALGAAAAAWPLAASGEWVACTPTPVLRWAARLAGRDAAAGTALSPARPGTRWTRALQAYWAAEALADNPHRAWWSGFYGPESRVAERRLALMLRAEAAAARERAVHALGFVPGIDRHAPTLGRLLIEDPSADVRFACFESLHGSWRPADRARAQLLAGALTEPDRDLRSYYALRLAMLPGGERHANLLLAPLRAARDGPGVWDSARKAIGEYEVRVLFDERRR